MQISVSGHHVSLTEPLHQAVENQFLKLQSHFSELEKISVILTVEPHIQKAEASTHFERVNLTACASDKSMYQAIAKCAKKLEATLNHKHGSHCAKSRSKHVLKDPLQSNIEIDTQLSD